VKAPQLEAAVTLAPHLANLSPGMDALGIKAAANGFRILFLVSGFREDGAPAVAGENAH